MERVRILRRVLSDMHPVEAMEMLMQPAAQDEDQRGVPDEHEHVVVAHDLSFRARRSPARTLNDCRIVKYLIKGRRRLKRPVASFFLVWDSLTMNITREQLEDVRNGKSVPLNEEGTDLIVLRADVFERIKGFNFDDSPWTVEEMDLLAAEDAEALGWQGMDVYQDTDL